MKNNRSILWVLLAGGLFIVLLKYSSGGGSGLSETKTGSGNVEQELRDEIATFRNGLWNEPVFQDLESRVGSAEMAHELSKTQYEALYIELSLAKRDALMHSFDEIRKNACSDRASMRPLVTQMETHKVSYGKELLEERITLFKHLEQFFSLEIAVNNCMSKMYSASLVSGIKAKIKAASSLSGVNDCPDCQGLRKKWIAQVDKLEGIDKSFNYYIKQRSMSYGACETFKPYAYYYKQLVDQGLCFN